MYQLFLLQKWITTYFYHGLTLKKKAFILDNVPDMCLLVCLFGDINNATVLTCIHRLHKFI